MTGRWRYTDEIHDVARTSAIVARLAPRAARMPPHLAGALRSRLRLIPDQETIR
jgi:hypothetical protein